MAKNLFLLLTLRQYDESIILTKLESLPKLLLQAINNNIALALDSRSIDSFEPYKLHKIQLNEFSFTLSKGSEPGKSNAQRMCALQMDEADSFLLNDFGCFINSPDWTLTVSELHSNVSMVTVYSVSFPGSHGHKSRYFQLENNLRHAESRLNCLFTSSGQLMLVHKSILKLLPDDVGDDCFCALYAQLKKLSVTYSNSLSGTDFAYSSPTKNFHARRRMVVRNLPYSTYAFFASIIYRPVLAFFIFSHKILRWLAPLAILMSFIFFSILTGSLTPICIISLIIFFGLIIQRNFVYGCFATMFGVIDVILCKRVTHY